MAAVTLGLMLTPMPVIGAESVSVRNPSLTGVAEPEEFGGLDIEQLSRVRIVSATLTPTQARLIPAETTNLDETDITQSGARTLNELLEIYTPNAQLIAHNTHMDHFGMRGIISDRDDKYLLRVDGKVMNNRMFVGAESERDLPLLGDFRTVTTVHGPASATYGAGALAGVLNLETHNGLTFEGSDAQIRRGVWDQFTSGEVRFGKKIDATSGLFLYAGAADQKGANRQNSPYVFGKSFTTPGATPDVVSGQPVDFDVPNLHGADGHTKMKVHASYVNGSSETWVRYTQSSGAVRPMRTTVATGNAAAIHLGRPSQDQQFTAATQYKTNLSDALNLETFVSYDRYRYRLWVADQYPGPDDRQEQELYGRVLGSWMPGATQSAALGLEYSHMWFAGAPVGFGVAPGIPPARDSWQTNTASLLAEHQWHASERWTTFASARADKHTYTSWLFSPRLALVFTPNPEDTLKLIGARAMRRNGDGELRQQHAQSGTEGATEYLDSVEFRYERQRDGEVNYAGSIFVEENAAIGFDAAANHSVAVGRFRIWGVEPGISYRTETTRLTLSHGYTKLLSATLASPNTVQGISAAPYGYGHDLANWANNITKLALTHDFDPQWSASTSLRAYWGFPGARAQAAWNGAQSTPASYALADAGYDKAYGPSVFWNAGMGYRPSKALTLRFDAFNIMGWFDKTLNKRLYYFRGSNYSSEAAAVAFSVKWAL